MASIDLREALNAISDVVTNRPRPLREFDQIFMKSADMLLQTELLSQEADGRRMVFIGDGDAIGLCSVHLRRLGILEKGPTSVHVLDFDERIVNSIARFAERFSLEDRISAELYNVADPLPRRHWQAFGAFYTNPPFGQSNDGKSIKAFVNRGIEALATGGKGCIVLADDPNLGWTQEVLWLTQNRLINDGFLISHILPAFHLYHLDDNPGLRSASMFISRHSGVPSDYRSEALEPDELANFYGRESPLRVRYVRDLTAGEKFVSHDHKFEAFDR